jgi:hypothetical protein
LQNCCKIPNFVTLNNHYFYLEMKKQILGMTLCLFAFAACHKEIEEKDFSFKSASSIAELDLNNNSVEKIDFNADLETRSIVIGDTEGDIDDVVELTSGVDISNFCLTDPNGCQLGENLKFRLAPGQRIGKAGIKDNNGGFNSPTAPQNLDKGINVRSRYTLNGRTLTTLKGKEHIYQTELQTDGNYRLQLSPKFANRDVDLFVFRFVLVNGILQKTLVQWSINGVGKTETLHLKQKGYYEIVVDSESDANGNEYTLMLSKNTPIQTQTALSNNVIVYKFSAPTGRSGIVAENLVGWRFRRAGATRTFTGAGALNSYYSFDCNTCDYLVTAIYRNTLSNQLAEYYATMFRP